MIYQDKEVKLKDGRSAVLRNARVEDSADLIEYLKTTATETPKTGDSNNIALWILLLTVGCGTAVVVSRKRKANI